MSVLSKPFKVYITDPGIFLVSLTSCIGIYFLIINFGLLAVSLYVAGWLLYIIEENLIHRFIFHLPLHKCNNKFLFLMLYRIHGGHHDQPYNSKILFTPFWFSIGMTLLNVIILLLVGIKVDYVMILLLGGALHSYLMFEWVHINCHYQRGKKSKLIKNIARYHNRHHFLSYHYWFSISPGSKVFDKLFGTAPAPETVKKSTYVRSVDVAEDDPRLLYARSVFGFAEDLKANN